VIPAIVKVTFRGIRDVWEISKCERARLITHEAAVRESREIGWWVGHQVKTIWNHWVEIIKS
jgi:hypothetical protein